MLKRYANDLLNKPRFMKSYYYTYKKNAMLYERLTDFFFG